MDRWQAPFIQQSASTLYRFLKQRGLSERQLLAPPAHKKFEAEHSNQIWQSDMLYGPYVQRPGGGKMQALLHAILDDASRLIPHAQFYASQGLDACLDCLRLAIAARGVPVRLYMDNAKIYRSPDQGLREAPCGCRSASRNNPFGLIGTCSPLFLLPQEIRRPC